MGRRRTAALIEAMHIDLVLESLFALDRPRRVPLTPRTARIRWHSTHVKPDRIARASKRRLSSFGVLALAIAVLLAHLGGTWHFATQEHVRCAEHGEWIDVSTHVPAIESVPTNRGPVIRRPTAPLDSDDHCVFFLASRARGIVWQVATSVSQPCPVLVKVWTPIAEPVESEFAIYLLAPKQSPPC